LRSRLSCRADFGVSVSAVVVVLEEKVAGPDASSILSVGVHRGREVK